MNSENYATEALNPITRSMIRLDPPLDMERIGEFRPLFDRFCDDAWSLPTRRDPQVVDPLRVIAGTEPVDPIAGTVSRLVAEYGARVVRDAVASCALDAAH